MKDGSRRWCMQAALLLAVSCTLSGRRANGWAPIGHFYITLDAAALKQPPLPVEVAHYANLPDYDGSDYRLSLPWLPDPPIGIVKESWCWSHGAQSAGGWPCPCIPVYPDDGRYPGEVMKTLLKSKLDLSGVSPETLTDLQHTVNGFRAHNAADGAVLTQYAQGSFTGRVHYNLFHAKEQGRNGGLCWREHHGMKEAWADYLVLIRKQFSDSAALAFDGATGMISSPIHIPFKGNAKLMHLAQMVCRKNRHSTDSTQVHLLDVQSLGEIQGKLDTTDTDSVAGKTHNAQYNAPWFEFWVVYGDKWEYPDGTVVDPGNPDNHRTEYELLETFADYTVKSFDDAHNPNSGPSDDWQIWDPSDIWTCYDACTQAARDWMYSTAELTP